MRLMRRSDSVTFVLGQPKGEIVRPGHDGWACKKVEAYDEQARGAGNANGCYGNFGRACGYRRVQRPAAPQSK
jgi:hypothetical protein